MRGYDSLLAAFGRGAGVQNVAAIIMDYGTLFFSNIASMTAFTVCVAILAWHNRRVVGMQWFAASLFVGLVKLILQGMEGKVPAVLSGMVANDLYLVSFVLQFIGLRWFVVRKEMDQRWIWGVVGTLVVVYSVLFVAHVPYIANILNVPFVFVCLLSAVMLWRHGKGVFAVVSHVAAVLLVGDALVAGYRAVLTNLRYNAPWLTVNAKHDAQWLESLLGMWFLATLMVMCEIWFLVSELQRELMEQASTDPLTGALNRRALEVEADREVARSLRNGRVMSMILLDVDNFKKLNDTCGHAAGDYALKSVVRRMKALVRSQDVVARTGGEEFTVLLPETDAEACMVVAERIRENIAGMDLIVEHGPVRVTVSQGVAQFDPKFGGWDETMRRADKALYKAKDSGKNLVVRGEEPPPVAV